jgi:hypothetical protein
MGIESNEEIDLVVFSQGAHKYFFSLSLSFEILKAHFSQGSRVKFLGTNLD